MVFQIITASMLLVLLLFTVVTDLTNIILMPAIVFNDSFRFTASSE